MEFYNKIANLIFISFYLSYFVIQVFVLDNFTVALCSFYPEV